jgi:hypothetical protein
MTVRQRLERSRAWGIIAAALWLVTGAYAVSLWVRP